MEAACNTVPEAHFASPASPRPIITSLNGDNSWLFSFPRPPNERAASGKVYYHVVFEPWLAGPAIIFNSWFVHITRASPPAVPDANAVDAVARQIEAAALRMLPQGIAKNTDEGGYNGAIDAILLGFHLADHTHENTLRLFDRRIPVIAVPEAAKVVKTWNHFESIHLISDFEPSLKSWRTSDLHPGGPVPQWLTLIRVPGHHELNFCLSVIWTHDAENGQQVHEAIFESPHGMPDLEPLKALLNAEPPTEKLALMHGTKENHSNGAQKTFGVKAGLAMYRQLEGVKHWVMTHNSETWYSGIALAFTRDTPRTLEWALDDERKQSGGETGSDAEAPNVTHVENGSCFVLE